MDLRDAIQRIALECPATDGRASRPSCCGVAEALTSIPEFLEKVYNERRLHSALGYLPPAEFDAGLTARNQVAATRLPL